MPQSWVLVMIAVLSVALVFDGLRAGWAWLQDWRFRRAMRRAFRQAAAIELPRKRRPF